MTQPPTRVLLVRHGRSTFNDQGRYQGSSDESVLTSKGRQDAQLVGHYLNQRLACHPIDLVYTSPLRRVQQTAHVIVQSLDPAYRPPIVVNPDLKEISLSLWEGLTYAQVRQQFPQQYQQWQQHPATFELPLPKTLSDNHTSTTAMSTGGAQNAVAVIQPDVMTAERTYFPVRQLYQAAKQFWQMTLSENAGKTILIVSHSGTIHALLSTALNISPEHHHCLQQSNCGISELTFRPANKAFTSLAAISGIHDRTRNSTDELFNGTYRIQLNQLNQTAALGEKLPKLKVSKTGLRLLLLSEDGLSPQHCERLAVKMRSLPLNFCITSAKLQAISRVLMQSHPETSFTYSQSSDFLQSWQQQWIEPYRTNKTLMTQKLITGLAIASMRSIQTLLSQTLCADDAYGSNYVSRQLEINPQYLSVIHYSYLHRPVVQTINTFM